jgi:transposase
MVRQKWAGADVSAEWFDVCVLDGTKRHEGRFAQSRHGFEGFGQWLKDLEIARVWIALEHTGGYERELALWLLDQGHKASIVDPQKVASFKASLGRRSKTDKVDAYILARFAKERRPALYTPRPDVYQELLQLVRHRLSLVEAKTQWRNRRSAPKTNGFVHAQQQTLVEVLCLQIQEVERQIRELVDCDPELSESVALVCTIKGMEFVSAVSFLAEAGPIQGYPNPESLALAAGLVPLARKSGKSLNGIDRIPYGNQQLRQSIAMSASVARRYNQAMALFAARIQARGGKSYALLNKAVRRKLCHIIWGILTTRQPFDPNKAIQNFPTPP